MKRDEPCFRIAAGKEDPVLQVLSFRELQQGFERSVIVRPGPDEAITRVTGISDDGPIAGHHRHRNSVPAQAAHHTERPVRAADNQSSSRAYNGWSSAVS